MTAVPSKDYRRQYGALWPEIEAAIRHAIFEDKPILGAAVDRFERGIAAAHGVTHAVGVGSGTDAARLLYRALEFNAGDQVVTNARTFPGVLSALALEGLRPVLVDCDPVSGLMEPEAVAAAIGPRTRAVLAVHMYGHPERLHRLAGVCEDAGVPLLEDAAQAHLARWRGRSVCAWGRAGILSFHPSKNLGAFGDGGAILTNDPVLAERLRLLRNLGKRGKYDFEALGANSKLDTLQAAILEVKLRHLAAQTQRRRALAHRYLRGLADLPWLTRPSVHPDAEPVWHLFVVRAARRDRLLRWLSDRAIRAGLHYPRAAHQHPGLSPHLGSVLAPEAERWAETVLTLPLSHEHTDREIDAVIEALHGWQP
jgi:dTDP-3-amino-3,4,6-trideoxy-alpha-D-glucose transaminase